MDQSEAFIVSEKEKKVCKLVKSLYSLKEAPKQWHEKFNEVIHSNGFTIIDADNCFYAEKYDDAYVVLCLYANDILIFSSNLDVVNNVNKIFGWSKCYSWY